jgi:hypothetical protein
VATGGGHFQSSSFWGIVNCSGSWNLSATLQLSSRDWIPISHPCLTREIVPAPCPFQHLCDLNDTLVVDGSFPSVQERGLGWCLPGILGLEEVSATFWIASLPR